MPAQTPPDPIDEQALDARLAELRAKRDAEVRAEAASTATTAMGLGLKIGVELVVSVVVMAGLGFLAGRYLGSAPAGMILGLFIGFGAGLRNVFRSAKKTGAAWEAAIEADRQAAKSKKDV